MRCNTPACHEMDSLDGCRYLMFHSAHSFGCYIHPPHNLEVLASFVCVVGPESVAYRRLSAYSFALWEFLALLRFCYNMSARLISVSACRSSFLPLMSGGWRSICRWDDSA
jgi:hypothetical protein